MRTVFITETFCKVFLCEKFLGFAESIDDEWIFYPCCHETEPQDSIVAALYSIL